MVMLKFYRFLLILSVILSLPVEAQVNKNGIPPVTNYIPEELNIGEQNLSITRDNRGLMYFGNSSDGILEYDGQNFRIINVPNNVVYSLATDKNGMVFVGGIGEFGFLKPDIKGNYHYFSLASKLNSSERKFTSVWKIYSTGEGIYFTSSEAIFYYDYKNINKIAMPEGFPLFSFYLDDQLYLGTFDHGLMMLEEDSFEIAKGGEFYREKNIFIMLPYDENQYLIGTDVYGIFIYNKENGTSTPFIVNVRLSEFLNDNLLYTGLQSKDEYIFGSMEKGVAIIDPDEKIRHELNKKTKLQDQVVVDMYLDPDDSYSPLWLALNAGISKAEINLPFQYFSEESGIKGQVTDIMEYNNKLYITTSSGVFYRDMQADGLPTFRQIKEIPSYESWSLLKLNLADEKILLVATSNGIFFINKNNRIESIGKLLPVNQKFIGKLNTRILYQSRNYPDQIYIGLEKGMTAFSNVNEKLSRIETGVDIPEEIRSIAKDNQGNLWLGTYVSGVIKISPGKNDTSLTYYNEEHGLPSLRDIHVYNLDDHIVFTTSNGLYKYDEANNRFVPDSIFGKKYLNKGVFKIYHFGNEYWLICYNKNKSWIEKLEVVNDSISITTNVFKRLPDKWKNVLYKSNDNFIWTGISNSLYSYNPSKEINTSEPFHTLIRSVTIGEDSLLFEGTFYENTGNDTLHNRILISQPDFMKKTLPYKYNNITFSFAAPFFIEEQKTEYSYYLEGFKGTWTKWSKENKAVYTNLSLGNYTFHVKARNVFGTESQTASYTFTILPPWYQTIYAYIAYIIFLILAVWGIVKYNTHRLKRDKIRLEGIVQERTAEIVKQKDEIENQRDQIAIQQKDITDSIKYASRIQRALLPSQRVMSENLSDHFILYKPRDIVSGDYYWMTQKDEKIFVVAADCTGHGVPGAFMSMLGMSFLNEIVIKSDVNEANEILDELREHVVEQLKQTGKRDETKDGMDMALVIVDKQKKVIQYSGANNPLYIVRELSAKEKKNEEAKNEISREFMRSDSHELRQVKADKMPIGYSFYIDRKFKKHEIPYEKGNAIYIFTDGYVDQFGGDQGKKFLTKNFKRLLLKLQDIPMEKQGKILEETIEKWKGDFYQIDDILVIGIKL